MCAIEELGKPIYPRRLFQAWTSWMYGYHRGVTGDRQPHEPVRLTLHYMQWFYDDDNVLDLIKHSVNIDVSLTAVGKNLWPILGIWRAPALRSRHAAALPFENGWLANLTVAEVLRP